MLLAQGVQVSMDGRGRCMDNVFVERLWRSIKYEEVYLKAYQNGTEARKGIGAYLAFYNQERPHQRNRYSSNGSGCIRGVRRDYGYRCRCGDESSIGQDQRQKCGHGKGYR